jgi:hypothetical protein
MAYTANPSLQHVGALKRILKYLAGTCNHGITYSKIQLSGNLFHGYANATYANVDDCKSTSGYVYIMAGGTIMWRLKKQTTVALSSTKAEYITLSEAGHKVCWLRNLFKELGFPQLAPTLLKGKNDGLIAMAHNLQFHKWAKHIKIRWHWVRDLMQNGILDIESCRDPEQTADVLTKGLPQPKHIKHITEMGLALT